MWHVVENIPSKIFASCVCALLLISLQVHADEKLSDSSGKNPQEQVRAPSSAQIATCEKISKDFRTAQEQQYFLDTCFDHYLGSAKPGAVKYSSDGLTLAFGFGSLLFSKVGSERFIITGAASRLSDIKNLALDAKNKEIWALDGDHLYAFGLGISGNRAPLRGLEGKWVRGVSALAVDNQSDEIFVLNSKIQRVLVYDRKSDMLYRSSSGKLMPKREIYSRSGEIVQGASLVLCNQGNEFGVLSPSQNKVSFFANNANGWAKPSHAVEVHPNAVAASCSDAKVQILDNTGSITEVSLQ